MSTFIRDRAWRWVLGVFVVARGLYSLWALAVIMLNPLVLGNLDLFGAPVLTAFDPHTSARATWSRTVAGRDLHFRAALPNMVDVETGSVWDLQGHAQSGPLQGQVLAPAVYSAEDVFPYLGVAASDDVWTAPWQRFDTNWYLRIAGQGYASSNGSTVYFPLYPLLIGAATWLWPGHDLGVALAISNLALVGVLYLLYHLASEIADPAGAARTLVYLVIFPTAFFLFSAYTEALFLVLTLAALWFGGRNRWGWAAAFGTLAALTRLQGVLLIVPLGYLWWISETGFRARQRSERMGGLWLLFIPFATACFLLGPNAWLGSASLIGAYEGKLHAQFVWPWQNLAAAVVLIGQGRGSLIDILNLTATLVFGGMVVVLWRQRWCPRAWTLYAACMYLAPLFRMTTAQPLVSMDRYVLAMFPVFVAWGRSGSNPWVNRAVLYVSFPLALYLSAQFVMWGWVG